MGKEKPVRAEKKRLEAQRLGKENWRLWGPYLSEFPYASLVEENRRRTPHDPPFSLLDAGVFHENRYWDIEVAYAKEGPECIFVRIAVANRGPETAALHLLPTLWFRNTWAWGEPEESKPLFSATIPIAGDPFGCPSTIPSCRP